MTSPERAADLPCRDLLKGRRIVLLGLFTLSGSSMIRVEVERHLSRRAISYALGFLIFAYGIGAAESWSKR